MNTKIIYSNAVGIAILAALGAFFLVGVGQAYAQCPVPAASGGVKVNHAMCQPAGPGPCSENPKKPGKDLCTCTVSGTQGGNVKGICQSGCCMRVSETSSADAAKAGGLGALDPSKIMEMLQKLMQGGGGGGGGGGEPPTNPAFGEGESILDNSFLNFDTGSVLDTVNDFIFGGGNDSNETTQNTTTNNDDTTGQQGDTANENAPGQEGDTVTTTYEYTEAVADNPLIGDGVESDTFAAANDDDDFFIGDNSDFDDDFFGAGLDDSDGSSSAGGLSREFLEAQGLLEASRLGADGKTHSGSLAIPYESLTPAEIKSLQNYHSSGVAVSGKLSPFENNTAGNNSTGSGEKGFFSKIVAFFANLLGLGAPATQ